MRELGYITHYFSSPEDHILPSSIYTGVGKIGIQEILRKATDNQFPNTLFFISASDVPPALDYPEQYNQFFSQFLGLEHKQEVYNSNEVLQQRIINTYEGFSQEQSNSLKYFKSSMYQYNYPGSYLENFAYRLVEQYLPYTGINNLIIDIFDLMNGTIKDHLFKDIERSYFYSFRRLVNHNIRLKNSITYNYFDNGIQPFSQTDYSYIGIYFNELKSMTTVNSDATTTSTTYIYSNESAPELNNFSGPAIAYLNSINYKQPVASKTSIDGQLVEENFTALGFVGNRIVPVSNWTLYDGNLSLAGVFEDHDPNGKPETYKMAKYGASPGGPANLFFDPITLQWNNQLQLESRTYNDFSTSYVYDPVYFELTSVTDPDNIVTEYTYDPRGRLKTANSLNNKQTATYDYTIGAGNNTVKTALAFTDNSFPNQATTQHSDGFGRPLETIRENDEAFA